ncbi:respiratory nitrate reductase subunit gamma [Methanolapillus ohkumae]|uniref:NarG-like domain-containing protein n=1 Tax=Methanolapillus ohkumae TaxID=3028298 RepID=A0AA96V744_9EURY|nr:hypothetical protein MsAm2_11530 [Methanosarcinaceae archaeon Am2]
MDYFSGIAGVSLTFVVMMSVCSIAIFLLIFGLILDLRKWAQGATGYGLEPEEGKKGNIIAFIKAYWKQLTSHEGVHHGQSFWKSLILDVCLQRRTFRASKGRWLMHMLIFVGWMGLFALSGLMFAAEITHMLGVHFDIEAFREMLQFPNQILGYILLIGVLIAVGRRVFIPKVRQNTNSYDSVLLITLIIVIVSGFVAHAGRYIVAGVTDFSGLDMIFYDYKIWTLGGVQFFNTYVKEIALTHSVLALFIGFAFIPYSKYIHMITTPLTILVNKGGEK